MIYAYHVVSSRVNGSEREWLCASQHEAFVKAALELDADDNSISIFHARFATLDERAATEERMAKHNWRCDEEEMQERAEDMETGI